LLNDNFSVEDNLNYTASVSQNLSDTSLQINNNIVPSLNNEINLLSQKSPDLVAFESMSDFVINLDTSFNLTVRFVALFILNSNKYKFLSNFKRIN